MLSEENPFEQSVEQQLTALRRANDEEKWGVTEDDFKHLASTAPAWPKGRHAYRSFRIRFGEGSKGVAKTFEAHCTRIKHVFSEDRYWQWEPLHSGSISFEARPPVERLRLLNGNQTHKHVIEWIGVGLDAHRNRDSITAVRNSKSLADELLVIAWMFPDMIRAIDYDKFPGLLVAGYEVNVPKYVDEAWQHVVTVGFSYGNHEVRVDAIVLGGGFSGYAIPSLRE